LPDDNVMNWAPRAYIRAKRSRSSIDLISRGFQHLIEKLIRKAVSEERKWPFLFEPLSHRKSSENNKINFSTAAHFAIFMEELVEIG